MIEKKIQISESLQGMLEQMTPQQHGMVAEMFKNYMEQFSQLRLNNNAESVSNAIHETIDTMMKETVEESEETVSCRKGCAFCCFQQVDISKDEATLLLAYTKEIDKKIDFDTLEKQREAKDFMSLKPKVRKCVFLDDDMSCSVYEHRPSACRKLTVVSDKNLCDTVKNSGAQVKRLVSLEAEIVTGASLNVGESGSMAEIILKQKKQ